MHGGTLIVDRHHFIGHRNVLQSIGEPDAHDNDKSQCYPICLTYQLSSATSYSSQPRRRRAESVYSYVSHVTNRHL